jgi:CMP-2-keto-3-deoxyoctulosonic acid synthetase
MIDNHNTIPYKRRPSEKEIRLTEYGIYTYHETHIRNQREKTAKELRDIESDMINRATWRNGR